MADETGEVQYATQTVTVTDRDAKALGQPVGSTTTVLLTAYPGGHSGASTSVPGDAAATGAVAAAGAEQQPSNSAPNAAAVTESQQFLTTTQPSSTAGNVQVVYSASHVDPIPDSMSSNPTNPDLAAEFTSTTTSHSQVMGGGNNSMGGMTTSQADSGSVPIGVSDYLNPTTSREVMMPHADSNVGGASEADTTNDLAAELILGYSLGTEGLERKSTPLVPINEAKTTKSPES